MSSAVLNGGIRTFDSKQTPLYIVNANVPSDYDGVTPNPVSLLTRIVQDQGLEVDRTVGLLTAASFKTLRVASRSSPDDDIVVVDGIVTAGIGNARRVGADADCFCFHTDDNDEYDDNDKTTPSSHSSPPPTFGTINTIVVTNATLTPAALVETYAIVVEAKCAACADLCIPCTKTGHVAQGTGTDCAVVVARQQQHTNNNTSSSNNNNRRTRTRSTGADVGEDVVVIQHAGKHTLFGEMVGQAVYEATHEALVVNIRYLYGDSWTLYTLCRWKQQFVAALARPGVVVPPKPMMSIPRPPWYVVVMGMTFVVMKFALPWPPATSNSARVVLAVATWDRFLGEPPLAIHPVVLTGRLISFVLDHTTSESVFDNPILGFVCGSILLLCMLGISLTSTHLLLTVVESMAKVIFDTVTSQKDWPHYMVNATEFVTRFVVFLLEVVLVKSACSLQPLCTIALQMAKFLERRQLDEARTQLSWLCSRDPSQLTSPELAGATLESLSENLSDGLVAPLLWYALVGPLGAMGYRVVNTLDSRIGYRGKFEWFGKPSARLDDVLNFVPARITALLLAIAALVVPECNAANGIKVAWRDCNQCKSPNAGWPMSTMAGLLGVRLEKKEEYTLGGMETSQLPGVQSIRLGQRVAQLAGGLAIVVAVMICYCVSTK